MMVKKNRNIIVIDDDQDIWAAYQEVLAPVRPSADSAAGRMARLLEGDEKGAPEVQTVFTLSFAAQGQEGYEIVARALNGEHPYAVAFIDIRMPPGWDGMETAARIRQLDPNIEIVIVTAYGDRSPGEIVRAVGSPEKLLYLRKPFDHDELTQIAWSLTEKWELARKEELQRWELQTVLTTMPAAIFTVDPELRITSWNPAAETITGYSAAEVMGQPCIFRQITDQNYCKDCLVLDREKQGYEYRELNIRDKSGRQRTILLSGSSVFGKQGQKIKVVESFWDITALREAEGALHRSESRFRALVETSSDWVWEVDKGGTFTYCSPVCEDIYGYQPEELLGKSLFDTLLNPEDAAEFKRFFDGCVERKLGFQAVERRSMRKDKKSIHIETSGVPVLDSRRQIIGFRGVDRDVSERIRRERERFRLEECYRQSQKMEALGTLASGIAHDLNNILTPIMGYAQLGQKILSGNDKIFDYLQTIENCAQKGADLIAQILAFTRKQVSVKNPVGLNDLILNFSKMLKRLIREDIDFQLQLSDELWVISADIGQIEQILINLVANARDVLSEGGAIVVKTRNVVFEEGSELTDIEHKPLIGSYVELSVSDNGPGMGQEIADRIFDPFFTTKDLGRGTGIGLSTVYGIMLQHEGQIRIDTQPGRGTTFYIYFQKISEALAGQADAESFDEQGGDETILLVEDSREVLDIVCSTLEHFGYLVIAADSGEEAVRLFKEADRKIDLLLTDVVMPGMGGKAVAETLRALQPDLAIIFMSGHTLGISPAQLMAQERTAFIQKPFKTQVLARKLREVLDGKTENG